MFLQKTHNTVRLLSHSFYLAEWCPDYSGPRSGIFVGYGGGLCGFIQIYVQLTLHGTMDAQMDMSWMDLRLPHVEKIKSGTQL